MGADMIAVALARPAHSPIPAKTDELVDQCVAAWLASMTTADGDSAPMIDAALTEMYEVSDIDDSDLTRAWDSGDRSPITLADMARALQGDARMQIEQVIDCFTWNREWTTRRIGPLNLLITGGLSWGDTPTDAANCLFDLFQLDPFDVVLDVLGFTPESDLDNITVPGLQAAS